MKRILLLTIALLALMNVNATAQYSVELFVGECSIIDGAELAGGVSDTEKQAAKAIAQGLLNYEASISVEEYGITKERISRVFWEARVSDPKLFYVHNYFQYAYLGTVLFVTPVYTYAKDEIPAMNSYVESEREKVKALIDDRMTDFEKVLTVHNYLVTNYEYDYSLTIRNIYDFFEEKTGVCEAYSLATKYILDGIGIECDYVLSESMNHDWNIVKIDGEWYHLDVTHDDPSVNGAGDILGYCQYEFFLKSDEYMAAQGRAEWECDYTATSTKYDNSFLNDYKTGVFHLDGKWYMQKSDKLVEVNLESGSTTVVYSPNVSAAPSRWRWWNSMNIGVLGDGIIYNTYDKIYALKPGEEAIVIMEPELSEGESIVGLSAFDETVYYRVGKERYVTTAVIMSFDAPCEFLIEEVVVSGGVLKADYKADIFFDGEYCVYVGGYDSDGNLIFAKILPSGEKETKVSDADYYKVFIWDKVNPLCETKIQ